MKNIALLGVFYDGYYDIWEDFLELKERYWPNCPYPMYIANNTVDISFEKQYDVKMIHAGEDALFSKRVSVALDKISEDYVLLLLEDFFFSTPLDGPVLDDSVSFMRSNNLSYYCMPVEEFITCYRGTKFKDYKSIQNIDIKEEYTLCCQAAIWEKSFLKQCIGEGNYNAWVFEGIYSLSKMAHKKEFLDRCKVDTSNMLGLRHGVLQGKMIRDTARLYEEKGYKMKNRRPYLDNKDYRAYLFKQELKTLLPLKMQTFLKKMYNTTSVIDKYRDDIVMQMKLMGIE